MVRILEHKYFVLCIPCLYFFWLVVGSVVAAAAFLWNGKKTLDKDDHTRSGNIYPTASSQIVISCDSWTEQQQKSVE